MEGLLSDLQFWTSLVGSVAGVGALAVLVRMYGQLRGVYSDRVEAVKEKASVIEERLRLSEDELNRLKDMNDDITRIGASLGVEGFREQLPPGVNIRDIGDDFSGKIAGRDINEMMNHVDQLVSETRKSMQEYLDHSTNYVNATAKMATRADQPGTYQYELDLLFERGDRLKQAFQERVVKRAEEGWAFHGLSADYQGTDGCVLVFKRRDEVDRFQNIRALKHLQNIMHGVKK